LLEVILALIETKTLDNLRVTEEVL
jgi:hypothetical protein